VAYGPRPFLVLFPLFKWSMGMDPEGGEFDIGRDRHAARGGFV
jgi:hypothetical protein